MENGIDATRNGGDGVSKWSLNREPKNADSDASQGGHKRSLSGSILGSLPFLRSSNKDLTPRSPPKREDDDGHVDDESSKRGSALANALRQTQGRKRKGSLRKTAILGTGKLRERRNSFLEKRLPTKPVAINTAMSPTSPDDETTPRQFSYEHTSLNSSSDSGWPPSRALSVSTDTHDHLPPRVLASPLTSPVGPYASTTDDDDGLSFFRPTVSSSSSSYNPVQLQPLGSSSSLQRRRSNRAGQNSSLTIVHTPADLVLEEEWDYSETEWWGWVVLIVTWVVFVVGMGSCLGVWSWAWDVGETPYAPPELEDDPTLPITGYYPALMVCTAVMSWVWVVVAWVGMKYFRHAKVVSEDG
ncbi:uncharacterized protein BDR25DRAFT_302155 [Lindgomyces ingoldianus]|uniref:Uncharacterized protein n=1 Tax=Lindgomyces ingoldianus TaxID=673940 RepID=A0ACB6R1K8_9PLEO|nr:uncharacterized protein BDR25DRAFT_302155 [Lindgomyces ingoldianus]KAF2473163.1 hypothetical protein BDR25DRAFT_302155 [Lindgomyces ingoldianus]